MPTLSLPDLQDDFSLKILEENEATRLFFERAQAANPGLRITDFNGPFVAEIVYQLDGLPLAIELAAARVRLMSLGELHTRLSRQLSLLTGGARDLPQRQQTLRKTIDWSYELLRASERHLLARLSVFAGGFSLDAAEAVGSIDGDLDVLGGIEQLLDNSLLIRRSAPDGTVRFHMLAAIREYAAERLAEGRERELIESRHSRYYTEQMSRIGYDYYSSGSAAALAWTDLEHDNLRAILTRSLRSPEVMSLVPDLILELTWYWYRRGFMAEGRNWSERILAAGSWEARSIGRAKALAACGAMAMWQGDLKTSLVYLQEGLDITRWLEDPFNMAFALMTSAIVRINMGQDEPARIMLNEANYLFNQLGLQFFEAVTFVHLANASLGMSDFDAAATYLDQATAIGRVVRESWLDSFALNNRGEVARAQGQYEPARGYYLESEQLLRQMGDVGDLARLVHTLGYIAQHEGDLETAAAHFHEGLTMFQKVGNQRGIAECLAGFASIHTAQGRPERAAALLAAASAIQATTGAAWWPADRVEIERITAVLQDSLDEDAYNQALTAGAKLTIEEAVSLALTNS